MCLCSAPRRSTSKAAGMKPAPCTRIRTIWARRWGGGGAGCLGRVGGDGGARGPAAALSDGMTVEVTVVTSETESEDTPIPFLTYYRDDSSLPEGEYAELQAGADGYVHREYAVTYENGAAVSRVLLSETVVEPDDRIIAQGTAVVAAPVAAPAGDPGCPRTLRGWGAWNTGAR